MLKVVISATSKKDAENLKLFHDHLCYLLDESGLQVKSKDWDGRSGGDNAYFALMDTVTRVVKL